MEEKNELNDIILNKGGSGSNSKKLLLAIAALTLILIIVLVIMNSLKSESNEQAPHAAVPPEPSAPSEIIDDPLFEPVEVIQEGGNTTSAQDLGQIAQKIKQESFQDSPVQETVVQPAAATPIEHTSAPAVSKPVQTTVVIPKVESKSFAKPVETPKSQPAAKAAQPVINTPTIKTSKPAETKSAVEPKKTTTSTPKAAVVSTEAKPTEKAADAPAKTAEKADDKSGIYYIQVGSFTKQPNQALFDRINASGLKYTTVPNGAATKVIIGPFQGEKAARDVLGTVRKNIESGAYITKG